MKQVTGVPKDTERMASGALVLVTVLFVCLKHAFGLVGFCTAGAGRELGQAQAEMLVVPQGTGRPLEGAADLGPEMSCEHGSPILVGQGSGVPQLEAAPNGTQTVHLPIGCFRPRFLLQINLSSFLWEWLPFYAGRRVWLDFSSPAGSAPPRHCQPRGHV